MPNPVLEPVDAFTIHPDIKRTLIRQNSEPFVCMRELVANSLDARASVVWIQLRSIDNGAYALDVQDNACGMDKQQLVEYAFTMFRSSSDDIESAEELSERVGTFGVGLFSTLALPQVQAVIYVTKTQQMDGCFLIAEIEPESLTYTIKISDAWTPFTSFKYFISRNGTDIELDLEVPHALCGTNVSVVFRSEDEIGTLREKVHMIAKRYFTFIDRDVRVYMQVQTGVKNKLIRPMRINALQPGTLIQNQPLVEELSSVFGSNQVRYTFKIDCSFSEDYDHYGLFFITGRGVVLVHFDELALLAEALDVKFKFSHCIITVDARGLFDYPLSREKLYQTPVLRAFVKHVFWEHMVRFAIKNATILSDRDSRHYNPVPLHYIQDIVAYLHACDAKGGVVFPDKDIEQQTRLVLYTRQIFPLYNGEYQNWVAIAEAAKSQNNELQYFSDRQLLEKLQELRMFGGQNIGQAFILATVANRDLLRYYQCCFSSVR